MKNYNLEIEKLQELTSSDKVQFMEINSFCAYPGQNVAVCKHPSIQFGSYHVHDFFEINYVQKGKCLNFVDGKTLTMNTGSLVLMHTGSFHTIYSLDESLIYNVLLRKEWFFDTLAHYPTPNSPTGNFVSSAKNSSYFKYLFYHSVPQNVKEILEQLYLHKANSPLLLESNVLALFAMLLDSENGRLSEARGSTGDVMLKMLSFISTQYDSITLSKLSELVGYSPTHICRLFKKNIGKSFGEVLTELRIKHAQSLLLNSKRAVYDIALSVGFENAEHFNRLFKKRIGITPGRYRIEKQSNAD